MTRLHSHCQQDSCGGVEGHATGNTGRSRSNTGDLRTSGASVEPRPQENPLSPRAIAERFDIEAEVKAILRQSIATYREFHPEEGQKQLSEILSKKGVPEVWAEGE